MRPLLAAFAALGLSALILAGCKPERPLRASCPAHSLCLEAGNVSEPVSLDPPKTTGTWEDRIMGDTTIGLTQSSAAGRPVPGMATSWDVSPDGLVWTFHLRKALWSDGVPVTANDFVFSLRRLMDPRTASEYAYLLYFIRNAEAVNEGKAPLSALGVAALDDHTLQLTLTHPVPYLPEIGKHQTFYPTPQHVVERWGDAWSRPEHYVSNGPFKLARWAFGDHITVVKNPLFYDARSVCLDQIDYYPTSDAIAAERRVRRGELDTNADIQSNRIAFLRQPDQIPAYVHTHTYLGVAYLAFNSRDVAAFRDRRVRLALDMAIDRDFITRKLLRGGQVPAYTFTPPAVANYQPPPPPVWAGWPIERRQAAARALLAQAGYGPGHPLKIEIKHRNSPDPTLFMPAVQADWKAIGVTATLAQEEVQIAYQDYRLRNFQVGDAAWIADFNDAMSFLGLQQSQTGAQNYGDYDNPTYDALLAKADNEPDLGKRAAYLAKAEAIMLADAPVAPVYFYITKNLVNPNVTGFVDNAVDQHRARYLCFKGHGAAAPSGE
ncbi:MAG: peptide ABC transporter substrate-binding protein [Caulobacteraceae bacterium]|nr:peptide ABC transporter substrate-binding protein [Caulobacteraceae bacterium]